MQSFKEILRWYKKRDVVPTLEALQKTIEFYHNKGLDMLKLGCTLPNLAKNCLRSSSSAKFYPLTGSDKELLSKSRIVMVGVLSIMFTRNAVLGKNTSTSLQMFMNRLLD